MFNKYMLGALLVTFLFVGYAHSYKVNYLIGESEEVEDFEGDDPMTTNPPTDPSQPPSTTPSGAVAIMASSLFTSAIAYIIL